MKWIFLAVALCPALALPQGHALSLYLGGGALDCPDIRYDRYIGNYGIGASPSLGRMLLAKTYLSSDRYATTWYAPSLHLSYRWRIHGSNHLVPEIKFIYSHYELRHFSEPERRIMKAFGVLPRLSYAIHFERIRLGLSGGWFGYLIQDWNDKALREARPLPVDGLNFGIPALGISAGYEI